MQRVTRTTRFLQCTVAHTAVWQRVATRGRRAAHDRDERLHVAARAAHQQHERQARHVRRRDVGRETRQRQPVPRRRRRAAKCGRQPPQRARAPVGARDVAGLGQAVPLMPSRSPGRSACARGPSARAARQARRGGLLGSASTSQAQRPCTTPAPPARSAPPQWLRWPGGRRCSTQDAPGRGAGSLAEHAACGGPRRAVKA